TGIPAAHFAGVIALYVYANSWNMTLVPALNLLGHRGLFVSLSVLTSALGLALSAAFAFKVSAEGAAWLAGQALGFAALGAAAFLALKRLSGEAFPAPVPSLAPEGKESFRDLRSFAAPLAAATFFLWLQTQSYRLIVERLAGAEFLGFLAVGLGIASSLAAVAESLVQQFYFPGFYSRLSSGGPEERREALAALYARSIPVYLVLAAFTAALSGQLTGLLVAPEFAGASAFVVFGAFIELFRMSSNIFAAAAHSEMRTAALVKPYAVGGLFTAAAVAAACFLPQREALIPAAMLAGGAVTFAAIRTHSSRLVSVPLSGALLLRALLFSAVFVLFLPARELTSPLQSALLIAAGGIYFLFASWRLSAAGPAGEGE
ncbi:MAG TPA: oligosaccharide flippase family protein, partial [Elusimicrobiales bacterium]|nr:oligosaccharide flippase family protein [Elusimicrobiales bacterium]